MTTFAIFVNDKLTCMVDADCAYVTGDKILEFHRKNAETGVKQTVAAFREWSGFVPQDRGDPPLPPGSLRFYDPMAMRPSFK